MGNLDVIIKPYYVRLLQRILFLVQWLLCCSLNSWASLSDFCFNEFYDHCFCYQSLNVVIIITT